ncbi:MAG: type III-B CRISPR module RAMP protein Cmr4 [Trichlorobacter sp.]|nr:type III-B CRISPR module RAMP protein Cmr4 [Trichlorobacter sp.]
MTSILTMYAVTPCHAGSGSSFSAIDLPIQRERHTNWPVIHASSMKGAMRAQFDRFKHRIEGNKEELTNQIFGSEKNEYAGSLSISDARILAFPMRSTFAPFVWITCPAVLARLNKDFKIAEKDTADLSELAQITTEQAFWLSGNFEEKSKILLEDMEVTATKKIELAGISPYVTDAERLLIVHDEVFSYGVSNCTSVMANIMIDQATGTTKDGSLRYHEELPSDTLLYSVVIWGDSRDPKEQIKADMIKDFVTKDVIANHIQVGGDLTLGRGIFEIKWQ